MAEKQYKRMYETRNVRPYYTIIHLGAFGTQLKELTGFGYTDTIYITSPEMNNTGYFEVGEMQRATEYFRQYWQNDEQVRALIKEARQRFVKTVTVEAYAGSQTWQQ